MLSNVCMGGLSKQVSHSAIAVCYCFRAPLGIMSPLTSPSCPSVLVATTEYGQQQRMAQRGTGMGSQLKYPWVSYDHGVLVGNATYC